MYFMLIGDTTAESNLRNGDYWDTLLRLLFGRLLSYSTAILVWVSKNISWITNKVTVENIGFALFVWILMKDTID